MRQKVGSHNISREKYNKIHKWLRSNFGKATQCDNPACPNISKLYTWALKKNHIYDFNRDNFSRLCRSCHSYQDAPRGKRGPQKKNTSGFPQVKARFYYPNKLGLQPKTMDIYTTGKTKRLYAKIRQGKFLKVYIKVLYGKKKTNFGKMEMFYNDGWAENKDDALKMLHSFLE